MRDSQAAATRTPHAVHAMRIAMLVAALALSSCGNGSTPSARTLSEDRYRAVAKHLCVEAKRFASRAARTSTAPAAYLRRAGEAAESIHQQLARVPPPARFAVAHRDSLRVSQQQLALIRATLIALRNGTAAEAVFALEAGSGRLVRRSNEIADELGVPECINEPSGP